MQNTALKDQRPDFNAALNGYRGLCALLVFVFHLGSAGIVPWPGGSMSANAASYLWSSLTYGVEMFFMISGFVILGSLLRHATVSSFLKDRFIRIYSAWVPALIAVTTVCLVFGVEAIAAASPLAAAGLFAGNLLLLPPIAPFPMIHQVSWSLSYEWVFYLSAAAGVLLFRSQSSRPWSSRSWSPRWWALAMWAFLVALFVCLFPRALFFLTGILVFRHQQWFVRHRRWLQFPVLSLLVFLVAWRATGAFMAHLNDTLLDFLMDGRWIAAGIAFAASVHMFASVCLIPSRQTAFLRTAVWQFLGKISYSFYLWHALVMAVVKRLVVPYVTPEYGATAGLIIFAVVSMAIALPVSWLSWALFEVRLAKIARKRLAPHPALGRAVRAA